MQRHQRGGSVHPASIGGDRTEAERQRCNAKVKTALDRRLFHTACGQSPRGGPIGKHEGHRHLRMESQVSRGTYTPSLTLALRASWQLALGGPVFVYHGTCDECQLRPFGNCLVAV